METNLEKLTELSKSGLIVLEHFYVISFGSHEINLQGTFTSEISKHYSSNGFTASINPNGYVTFTKDNVVITLT
jgi:hypothetical protein